MSGVDKNGDTGGSEKGQCQTGGKSSFDGGTRDDDVSSSTDSSSILKGEDVATGYTSYFGRPFRIVNPKDFIKEKQAIIAQSAERRIQTENVALKGQLESLLGFPAWKEMVIDQTQQIGTLKSQVQLLATTIEDLKSQQAISRDSQQGQDDSLAVVSVAGDAVPSPPNHNCQEEEEDEIQVLLVLPPPSRPTPPPVTLAHQQQVPVLNTGQADSKNRFSQRVRFKCGKCDRIFYNRENCENHLKSHSTEQLAGCLYCKQAFKDKAAYHRHITSYVMPMLIHSILSAGKRGLSIMASQTGSVSSKSVSKHNLSSWEYTKLREVINTSCDVEFLEACRLELDRRLEANNALDTKYEGGISGGDIHSQVDSSSNNEQDDVTSPSAPPMLPQRYFKVSLPPTKDNLARLWYAHFDGEDISRQLEIEPGREVAVLVAGKDTQNMCGLKLTDTGLTEQESAEISETEFEAEWRKHKRPDTEYQHQEISPQKRFLAILLLVTILLSDFCAVPSEAKGKKVEEVSLITCFKCTDCMSNPNHPVGCRGKQDRCIKLVSDNGMVMRDCATEWGEESDGLSGKNCHAFVDGYKTCYCDTDECNAGSLPHPSFLPITVLTVILIIICIKALRTSEKERISCLLPRIDQSSRINFKSGSVEWVASPVLIKLQRKTWQKSREEWRILSSRIKWLSSPKLRARICFDKLNIKYHAVELNTHPQGNLVQDILLEMTGARTVPRVFINGKCIGGGSDTVALFKSGELQTMAQ
ncbi:Myosin heavy chain 95F [Orchesella cincta]|uniref:Myosin heavy chain 95F n=1 Tax=Orchesella cincta TaxID=48709 RepID=A0A1D2MYR5_ORCCI|nr:Myosin heavy chain 95F [Orchesella cincta]